MGEDYARRFEPRALDESQRASVDVVRDRFALLARQLDAILVEGREKSLVMTKLEEASFFAIASVARRNG